MRPREQHKKTQKSRPGQYSWSTFSSQRWLAICREQCIQGGLRAHLVQTAQGSGVRLGEFGVINQIAKDFAVAQKRQDILAVTGGIFLQALSHAVVDINGLAMLVDAFGIARPRGE